MSASELIARARVYVGEFSLAAPSFTAASVAAALLSDSGQVYCGVCVDVACGIGFCAEHAAVAAMLKERETVVRMMVAVTENAIMPPCGRCRELLWQLDKRNADCCVIVSEAKQLRLETLLPCPWL